jgi:hypothetical protein
VIARRNGVRRSKSGARFGFSDRGDRDVKLSQLGDPLEKLNAHIDWELFRADLAKIYSERMVLNGQHHTQALVCRRDAFGSSHLTTCRMMRPFELRDVDGSPIDKKRAREII